MQGLGLILESFQATGTKDKAPPLPQITGWVYVIDFYEDFKNIFIFDLNQMIRIQITLYQVQRIEQVSPWVSATVTATSDRGLFLWEMPRTGFTRSRDREANLLFIADVPNLLQLIKTYKSFKHEAFAESMLIFNIWGFSGWESKKTLQFDLMIALNVDIQ